MKKRTLALALTAALALSLLGAAALAAEGGSPGPDSSAAQSAGEAPQAEDSSLPEDISLPEDRSGPPAEETGPAEEPTQTYIPDPVGSISFANLESRMREGSLSLLALEEQIQVLESIDYDEMKEDIRKGLNEIANQQWQMISMGSSLGPMGSLVTAAPLQSLQSAYDSTRKTFDDIKEGKLQKDNGDIIRQLENAQNQVVMAGETLYIALLDMERSAQGLDRQLTALDRTLEELELRYELGHISSQTLKQTQAGRTSLVSGQQTLDSNIDTYKMQLELLIGAELTGNIRLGALPQVTAAQLGEMDLEADLSAAKEASYSLYSAKLTLNDAEEEFKDKGKEYNHNEKNYEYVMAKHQWQAAQHNYAAAVQNYEMSFRTLYLQVKDCKQVLDAAKTALAVERDNYAVAQLKQSQGKLSQNALLDAEDKVKQAQETVDGASIDLFTAYHNYRWAVDYGILN
ncbi:TolC family protein [Oscillospiraceae bacterium 44-34]